MSYTIQTIDVGSSPNDGTGDPLRPAFIKINENFANITPNLFSSATDVYYVKQNGNDAENGLTIATAFATIKRAVEVANVRTTSSPTARVTIFVKSGTYVEQNPIVLAPRVTIWGDNLRAVSVVPANPTQDIFHVVNACYLSGMTFRGHLSPAAAVAFPDSATPLTNIITTSPYVQNCSSITTTGMGMRVDGNKAGGLKSMVLDAYTQVNQNGKGIYLLNQGYAQLVSIFTVCCSESITCESGATCSVTNSNTSFGNLGLVARGKVTLPQTGTVVSDVLAANLVTISGLTQRPNINWSVSFDGGTTLFNIWDTTELVGGQVTILMDQPVVGTLPAGSSATFYIRSTITSSGHTFEYVGSGTDLATCLPQTGAIPIQANEVVTSDGGQVIYTSTDQKGDFRIGDNLTINGATGTISGDTFDKSLFAVLTPYILAIEG